jgi:N-acetylmuramoyl-L-alanine amidase
MSSQPPVLPPNDEDAEFDSWRAERRPPEEERVSPSVAFMAMMRQAAERNAAEQAEAARVEVETVAPPPPTLIETAPPPPPDDAPPEDAPEPPPRRRLPRRGEQTSAFGGCLRALIIVLTAAGLTATIFTWATPNDFLAGNVRRGLSAAIATEGATAAPTPEQTPNWLRRIGVVSGHRGPENDPGAVCPDGWTEAEVNLSVAERVVRLLNGRGYVVELLDEFDARLNNFRGDALVSIHANTCRDFGERVSGFMIAAPAARISARGNDTVLVECIATEYARATRLQRRLELTRDMTEYHTFSEIHPLTPAAIIELGFMLGDRQILENEPDLMAEAITEGVICFLEPGRLG